MTRDTEIRAENAANEVAKALEANWGRHFEPKKNWIEVSSVRSVIRSTGGQAIGSLSRDLQKAAAMGLILADKIPFYVYGSRGKWYYTTHAAQASAERERSLSDRERAERTAAQVFENGAMRMSEYPDSAHSWPVPTSNIRNTDGIAHAVALGLVKAAFLEQTAKEALVESALDDRFNAALEILRPILDGCYDTRNARRIEISIDGMERLAEVISMP